MKLEVFTMKKYKEFLLQYSNLPRGVYILFITNMITKLGNFVIPFLTLYLTKGLNFPPDKVGFLIMIGAGFYIPGSLIGGRIADHHGRKYLVILSQLAAALCFIPCVINPYSIYSAYFIFGFIFFGAVTEPGYIALISDFTSKKNRNEVFSLLYIGSNVGTAIGAVLAGYLFNEYIRYIFIGNIIAIIISVTLVQVFIDETYKKGELHSSSLDLDLDENEKATDSGFIKAFLSRPILMAFSLTCIIFSFTHAQCLFVIPLQTSELFGNAGSKVFGYVITVNSLVVVTLTTFVTTITKRFPPLVNITLGGVMYFIGFGMLYFVATPILFIVSSVIWSIGEILVYTNQSIFIISQTPISHRGRFNAVLPLITGAGRAVGPAIMGKFIALTEIKAAWLLIMVLISLASMIMYFLQLPSKRIFRKNFKTE